MITGIAPTGSSTPPICAAAEMWQFLPICAQLPTSACESTMVPSPTYAPALMYIGGMQVTPRPTKQPSRMLEPPGTMRTPLLRRELLAPGKWTYRKTAAASHRSTCRRCRPCETPAGCPSSPRRSRASRVRGRIRLGRADSPRSARFELLEKSEMFFGVRLGLFVERAFDLSLQRAHSPRLQEVRAASSTFSIFARFSGLGAHMGRRNTGSSSPISPIAAFTGIGFDSTKLMSISGR